MKMLMFYSPSFWWKPHQKALPEAGEVTEGGETRDSLVCFIHAEPPDGQDPGRVVTRAVKNIKWLSGKFGSREVVLHSFSHLSLEKADPATTRELLEAMAARLVSVGYRVDTTPYGYTCSWGMEVVGDSLGRVFVDIPVREGSRPGEGAE